MLPANRTLTILDPTSLLGREVTDAIVRAFPEVRRRLFHTGVDPEHLIAEVGGASAIVPPLVELDELQDSGAVIVTEPPPAETAERLLRWLRERPMVALLDCTQPGIAPGDAVTVVDAAPGGRRGLPWYHLVDPSLAAPARWLRAMLPLAPDALHLTVLRPASGFGAEALEELAAQGSARLSGRPTRRPHHLPAVLAFDLAPAGGDRLAALERQLAELFPAVECGVHVVDSGVFHGHLATAVLHCAADVAVERARALLRALPVMRLARHGETVTASASTDEARVICGDLRARGRWLTAWLLADGLRVGGAAAAVDVLASFSAS